MHVRILDLDGAVARQRRVRDLASRVVPLSDWGPNLRIACTIPSFNRFERDLARRLGGTHDRPGTITFVGSGDFHHVSLALLRRQTRPFNLLILDNHPDWMGGVPFLHCGTWVAHALGLPLVHRVFHVGGDMDFDNAYCWLAPWSHLRSGKVVVLPARRRLGGPGWSRIPQTPLRERPEEPADPKRIEQLLAPWRSELARLPLYVSLDRDVMNANCAAVNWDSGHLTGEEVKGVLESFLDVAPGLAGMDVVGDWSSVCVKGLARHVLTNVEHPRLQIDPEMATATNEAFNLELLDLLGGEAAGGGWERYEDRGARRELLHLVS